MGTEFDWIGRIRQQCKVRPPVVMGIGDDAALLDHTADPLEVVTTDMLMDGTDFHLSEVPAALIGRKCLAVNLSDIAAMGAFPTAAFVSVALPRQISSSFADEFMQGLIELADQYKTTVAGGDTNSWKGPFVCSVTVLGTPIAAQPVFRSGAKPGDVLCVTGACGGSLSGRHLTFDPRLPEARHLVDLVDVHAMLDLSDGLAGDLHHLLTASQVGAVVRASTIPIHTDAVSMSRQLPEKTPLQRALSDGEDFELLFAVSPDDYARLQTNWRLPTPITAIGEITKEPGCWLEEVTGERTLLPPLGWVHPVP